MVFRVGMGELPILKNSESIMRNFPVHRKGWSWPRKKKIVVTGESTGTWVK